MTEQPPSKPDVKTAKRPDAELLEALRRLDASACLPTEALLDLTRKPA